MKKLLKGLKNSHTWEAVVRLITSWTVEDIILYKKLMQLFLSLVAFHLLYSYLYYK